ncbi:baeRF3 domain-containing protein [Roseivirga echinicomitans]
MTIRKKLEVLAAEKNTPCVTISLNTHRTHPASEKDVIQLKNLLKEAEDRLVNEFGKSAVSSLLEKLASIKIDPNYNLDSLHIFLSNDTKEIIKSPWPTHSNSVQISDSFAIRSLIKSLHRSEEYLILLLSQGGVSLYNATNDEITNEVTNDNFPFSENPHEVTNREKRSDGELMDNMVREYFNKVDKAVVEVCNETGLDCVVITTEDNYSRLMQVADRPVVYLGYADIDYNNTETHQISKQAWGIVEALLYKDKTEAISEMKEAVGKGLVHTDLQEIFQAALDGRGDLLLVNADYAQSVNMTSDRTFELVKDNTKSGVIDDITSEIAWNVFSKNGRVIFTTQDEIKELGNIVLKTRF